MTLPVDDIFANLVTELKQHQRVILQAPPGAGKSTRLPLLLLQSGLYSTTEQIVILEPRRVAARQIAHFLAKSLEQKIGQQVGLTMRGQNLVSKDTVIRIVTDGVMVRQLQQNPELENVGLVIFDEFHERALQTDLALALTIDAQELNEDVRILIMSATLDLTKLSTELNAPVVESQGRQFPVDINYCKASLLPSIEEIGTAVSLAIQQQDSSILVFLSGIGEIKRLEQWLEQRIPDNCDLFPLFGGLSIEEQVQAIEPAKQGRRKIVLATNIAQTSLTIDGIDVVVDAGTERVNSYNAKTGVEQLQTQPISIASSIQRAGRAGRLRAGVCYRLGSKEVFERRRQHDIAEIERVDLAQLLLEVSLWGAKFEDLFWLSKPDASQLTMAEQSLLQLGYWQRSANGYKSTELVAHFQRLGLGLRFSKMLALAEQQQDSSLVSTGALLACYLEQNIRPNKANLAEQVEYMSAADWQKVSQDLHRLSSRLGLAKVQRQNVDVDSIGLLMLWAYPDRIAKKQGKRWKMANGSSVEFHSSQPEPSCEYIVVTGVNSSEYGHYVQSFCEIAYQDIATHANELIQTRQVTQWSEQKQSPQRSEQVRVGQLVVAEKVLPLTMSEQDWQQVWCSALQQQGWQWLERQELIVSFINKLKLAKANTKLDDFPNWTVDSLMADLTEPENWLAPYVGQIRKLPELKKLDISKVLLSNMSWQAQQEFAELCPDSYQTPAGNQRKIDYSREQPKLSVKLQEMFGEPASPAICRGQVPLTIELLSPAQRPLQVTQDLADFWQNAYVEVKKEMKGRYPKHPWPDDPVNFQATTKTKRQLNK